MKYKIHLIFFATISLLIACSSTKQKITIEPNVIKVYVDKKGQITANGESITLIALDSAFSKLKPDSGMIWYSRENAQGEPAPEALKIMDLIFKYSFSIRFYTDKTFTRIADLK